MSRKNVLLKEEQIYHVFQPIFNLKEDKVLGYEAFIRSKQYVNPEHLFNVAKQHDILFKVDVLSIRNAIKSYCMGAEDTLLFLNVYPSTIMNEQFPFFIKEIWKKNPMLRGKIVFEINEDIDEISLWDECEFLSAIYDLKTMGYKIAIDDVGKGAASLKNIISVKPNFLKLDKFFSDQLSQSPEKRRLITLLLNFCNNTKLIIEGIETKEDLQLIRALNVSYGQGYLLGMPKPFEHNIKSVFSV